MTAAMFVAHDRVTPEAVADRIGSVETIPFGTEAICGQVRPASDTVSAANESRAAVSSSEEFPTQMSRDRALTFNVIGPRLIAARELNGIPQGEAARLAGMANATQWSLYEKGHRAPPLYVVLNAANVLGISVDFLFGLTSDPERDARAARRNACVRATRAQLTQVAEDIANLIDRSDTLAGPSACHFRELIDAATALTEAVATLHRLNVAEFEEARGGATVLAAAERLERVQMKCSRVLSLHDAEAEQMRTRLAAIGSLEPVAEGKV